MNSKNNMSLNQVTGNQLLTSAKNESIHIIFESIALKFPDVEAVVHNEQSISYQALDEKANYVARYLTNKGIQKGDIVGVKLDKGIDLIISILAVMKAGAAYAPIDPTYPAARINYMLEDSRIRFIVTSSPYIGDHPQVEEVDVAQLQGHLEHTLQVYSDPQSLAYLIYTSGTTGNPKGVMVAHAGFINMCLYQIFVYQLGPSERVLQFASISFDASVYEIFIALLSGSTLVIVDKDIILDKNLFLGYLDKKRLTFILLPPVFLNSLNRPEFETVKTIVTAGEACNISDALYYSQTKRYFNAYGPTEASVCVSVYQVMPEHVYENYIPIGKAIPNIRFYILDEELNPVADGETGELYISGIGLAKGYINKPELTQKAFLDLPNKLGERIYRAGDIVKKLDDGTLIILGRKDDQVKILGHRIELGAIEHALLQIHPVTNAFVCALEHEGEKYLCAYFTAEQDILTELIREKLLGELPAFMVPHWFMRLPEFKMTNNGKIDKKALPSPFAINQPVPVNAAQPLEGTLERVLDICKEMLGIQHLDLSDNFFLMGGHSLKAAKLSAKISKEFNVDLSVSDIYKKPHITQIHDLIKTSRKSYYEPILPAPVKKYYTTSAAQKRMFVMNSTDKVDVSYNVSIVLQFEKRIIKEAIQLALQILYARQEVLRTRFDIQSDEIVQEVLTQIEVNLLEGGRVKASELTRAAKQFVRPFDLSKAPILHVGYYEIVQGGIAIIFNTHHIIADGTSMGILVNEFIRLLNQEPLPSLPLQYKDYAEWETIQYANSDYFKAHEQYWLNTYRNIPRLTMPTDRTADIQNFAGERLSFTIDKELTWKLKEYALSEDVSLYQLLLSVYYLLLSKYTQQQDIVVGTAVANRRKEELQQMMGMFVNTLALRATIPTETTFSDFVINIKNQVLEAFEFQEYPFELLVSKLGLSGNDKKVPLIDTLFIVQNIDFFSEQAIPGLTLKYENATATSKFDFSFFIVEQQDSFTIDVEYNTGMFSKEYMCKLAENFIKLAGKAVSSPSTLLEEITFIDNSKLSELRAQLFTENTITDVEFDI
ncbi:amino acid adenylation domain-containing protein [Rhodocytophaga rosea]|uniref:Amino acid adenylation domain-containing protein n=1 Tax=Rhodocytophaga rosea TaxID=2704465 RepID=A0A6C0GMU5_9BACT|nr:non-ribosomal peptide synthetase [Rhodocytophaga rosea]QHT69345.1 amino acid adenylation domain-containing protein [Rhodocytophaga rosea]